MDLLITFYSMKTEKIKFLSSKYFKLFIIVLTCSVLFGVNNSNTGQQQISEYYKHYNIIQNNKNIIDETILEKKINSSKGVIKSLYSFELVNLLNKKKEYSKSVIILNGIINNNNTNQDIKDFALLSKLNIMLIDKSNMDSKLFNHLAKKIKNKNLQCNVSESFLRLAIRTNDTQKAMSLANEIRMEEKCDNAIRNRASDILYVIKNK